MFANIDDKELRKNKQLEIYIQAKKMQEVFRKKVDLHLNLIDKAYFTIQEFLQRKQKPVLALNPATENRRNKWEVGEDIKEATNEVSKQFENKEVTKEQVSKSVEERR